jgi:hypothetical protein
MEILISYAKEIDMQFSSDCKYLSIHWKNSSKKSSNLYRLAIYEIGEGKESDELSLEDLEETLRFI